LRRNNSIFYSTILLTSVHLLLRLIGTSFQVYLSGKIGASGIGLLQLTLSVGSFAMIAGMAGVRTATMYLAAEELGRKHAENIKWVLSCCFRYSLLISVFISLLLWGFAPKIALTLIGDPRITGALRLFSAFLPVSCMCGVLTGYFTAANRITVLAAVEIIEQLFSMSVTVSCLAFWAGSDPARACQSVILGSGSGSCLTLIGLLILRVNEQSPTSKPISVQKRLTATAIPLALADLLKASISTTENLMVPKRLSKNTRTKDPLAAFGVLSGMVFPILMFPTCILHGLADLLIPELARCHAAGNHWRIQYLVKRTLRIGLLYGVFFGGALFLSAEPLCMKIYSNPEAGHVLKRFAPIIPMLYCDLLVDAMTKGLGQQRICVRYNIITSTLDVILLFFWLPKMGMAGYFASFLITHLLNFMLSLNRLMAIVGEQLSIRVPILSILGAVSSATVASWIRSTVPCIALYSIILCCMLRILGVWHQEDLHWMMGLLRIKRKKPSVST